MEGSRDATLPCDATCITLAMGRLSSLLRVLVVTFQTLRRHEWRLYPEPAPGPATPQLSALPALPKTARYPREKKTFKRLFSQRGAFFGWYPGVKTEPFLPLFEAPNHQKNRRLFFSYPTGFHIHSGITQNKVEIS